jgi:hypothetical protein
MATTALERSIRLLLPDTPCIPRRIARMSWASRPSGGSCARGSRALRGRRGCGEAPEGLARDALNLGAGTGRQRPHARSGIEALLAVFAEQARVNESRLVRGLSLEETAEVLLVCTDTLKRDRRTEKAELFNELEGDAP